MKPDPAEKERRWQSLVQQARADVPPALDVEVLLRSLPRPSVAESENRGWFAELAALVGPRVWLAGSAAAAALMVSGWMVQEAVVNDLPWIELAASADQAGAEEAL